MHPSRKTNGWGPEQISARLCQIVDRLPPDRREAFYHWCQSTMPVHEDELEVTRTPVLVLDAEAGTATPPSHLTTPVELSSLQDTAPPSPEIEMARLPAGGLLDGRYKLIGKVGEGAYSTVYRAKDNRLNTYVAVKLLKTELSSDPAVLADLGRVFSREAQIQAPLNHPNIVRVLDANVTEKGTPYIVTEFVDGEPLSRVLGANRPLPLSQVREWLDQLCSAVQYAHDEKVIHRDLKPGNIVLLEERGRSVLKVLDFGLATLVDRAHLTLRQGAMLGTPAYMAPEQWAGASGTPLSDIYSVAIILYEMVTGRLPFDGSSSKELGRQHREMSPPDPCAINSELPRTAAQVILKSLSKEPRHRASSASILNESFAAAFQMSGGRRGAPANRLKPVAMALAAVVIAAASFAVYKLLPVRKPADPSSALAAALERLESDPSQWRDPLKAAVAAMDNQSDAAIRQAAERLRDRAVEAANQHIERKRLQAAEAEPAGANQAFKEAAAAADEVIELACNPPAGAHCDKVRMTRRLVLDDWIKYGRTRLEANNAADAVAVAEGLLKLVPHDEELRLTARGLLEAARSLAAQNGRRSDPPIMDTTGTNGTKERSPAEQLAEAMDRAKDGDWTTARRILGDIEPANLDPHEIAVHRAIGSLEQSRGVSDEPAQVLELLAAIDLKAIATQEWLSGEIEAERDRAVATLLVTADEPAQNRDQARKILQYYPNHVEALFKLVRAEQSLENYEAATDGVGRLRDLVKDKPDQQLQLVLEEASLVTRNTKAEADAFRRVAADIRSQLARVPGNFELLDSLLSVAATDRADESVFDQAVTTLGSGRDRLPAEDQKRLDVRLNTEASKRFREGERLEKANDLVAAASSYRRARVLHTKPPTNYLLALARTASETDKYRSLACEAYEELIASRLNEINDPYDLMLKSARTLRQGDRNPDALLRYAQIADFRDGRRHPSFYKQAKVFHSEVIQPALELGEELLKASRQSAVRRAVARLYGAQGILILDNDWEDWKAELAGAEPVEEAFESLDRACKLYPDKDATAAQFFTKLGFARKRLAKLRGKLSETTFAQIELDAAAALEADPEFPGGHHLSADVLLDRAEMEASVADYEEAKRQTNASIQKLTDAAKGREDDPHSFSYFLNRSIARLFLGHYYVWAEKSPNQEEVQGYFERSVADAQIATKLRAEDPNGWAQLGNASEDLAWSRFGKQTSMYGEAYRAFEKQIETSFHSAKAHANLGRCLVKWILDEPNDPPDISRLEMADKHLTTASEKDPEYFETVYWTGVLRLLQNDLDRAIESFASSLTCPGGRQNWPRVVERVGAQKAGLTLKEVERILDQAIPQKPAEQHAWLLLHRSGIKLHRSVLDEAYKQDMNAAFALVSDKKMRAELYDEAILMHRWARDEAKKQRQLDKADSFNRQANQQIEELVAIYMQPDGADITPIARLSDWAGLLAGDLMSKKEHEKALKAIGLAIRVAPINKQDSLRRIEKQMRERQQK